MSSNAYLDGNRQPLTEQKLAYYPAGTYGKNGFTADGNSRLILRVQSERPGTCTFSINDDNVRAKLENLTDRAELTPNTQLRAADVGAFGYQASAVMIAPEDFPASMNFPSGTFGVHVKFTADDGTVIEQNINISLEAAPVLLVHGLMSSAADTFGAGSNNGVWGRLNANKFTVDYWDYGGVSGPTEIFSRPCSGLFIKLKDMFDKYAERGIACTKADIVAHGMGGLMVRHFCNPQDAPEDGNYYTVRSYRQGMVRRLITIATPHRGTPWANFMLGDFSVLNPDFVNNPEAWMTKFPMLEYSMTGLAMLPSFIRNMMIKPIFGDGIIIPDQTWQDNAVGSYIINSYYPVNVPMYAMYGQVKSFINDALIGANGLMAELNGMLNDWIGVVDNLLSVFQAAKLIKVHPMLTTALQFTELALSLKDKAAVSPGSAMNALSFALQWPQFVNDILFNDEDHDMHVSVSSAAGDFAGYSQGFKGWRFRQSEIGRQNEIGNEAAYLLKGPKSNFKVFNTLTSANYSARKSDYVPVHSSDNNDENINIEDYYSRHFNLSAAPNELSISSKGRIKFTAISDEDINSSVYLVITSGGLDRILVLASQDKRHFGATIEFTSKDSGAMSAYCFVRGNEEGKLYISNTENFTVNADLNAEDVTALKFLSDTILVDVDSETEANLFIETSSGNSVNVSSLASWTASDTKIAGVTDSGNIKGLKAGTTTLTASYKGFTASVNVEVRDSAPAQEAPKPKKPKILTKKLPSGRTGRLYTAQLESNTEGTAWTAENLPAGLTCTGAGLVSGVPSESGKFKAAFTATANGLSKTKKVKIVIDEQVTITTQELPEGITGKSYKAKIDYTGPKKTRVNISAGAIPDGMKFTDKGKLSGKTLTFGTFEFTVRAANTEDESNLDERTFRLSVIPEAPVIKTKKLKKGTEGKNYLCKLKAKSKVPVTWEISGTLPEGLTLDSEAGIISGVPAEAFDGLVTLRASNAGGSDTKTCSLTVKAKKKPKPSEDAATESNDYAVPENTRSYAGNDYAGYSDLRPDSEAVSDEYTVIARLGRIEPEESGIYDFAVVLDEKAPEGAELFCFMNSDAPSEDDEIAEFSDTDGEEISAVPENREITVSVWLNAGRVYEPVIAIKH